MSRYCFADGGTSFDWGEVGGVSDFLQGGGFVLRHVDQGLGFELEFAWQAGAGGLE